MQPDRKKHATPALGTRGTTRLWRALVVGLAVGNVAWLDPVRDTIAEGNRLFHAGQFEEALTRYGEVLVDDPDSPLVNFNMGAAHYKAGNYEAALSSFVRVPSQDDTPPRAAQAVYNLGNTQYQIGAATEAAQPQAALKAYTAALAAYRRALGLEPGDQDTKFNYELVTEKIRQLKERIQNQQSHQPQRGQPDRPQPNQDHTQQERQPGQDDSQDRRQDQRSPQTDRRQESAPDQQQGRGGEPQQSDESAMSEEEASALIDTAKSEELRAEEFIRQAQGGGVAEPLEDW